MGAIFPVEANTPRCEAMLRIYRASFPEWEKEPEERILERLETGRYRAAVYEEEGVVTGFYLFDVVAALSFTLFSFLAVDPARRGAGIGTKLCRHAIALFESDPSLGRWLFIEAQERQARFYGRMGFEKIAIDYRVPAFGSEKSVPMHLMVISREAPPDAERLRRIVREIFVDGYFLSPDDPRIAEQLSRIPDEIETIPWPRSET